ncbi:MAG TPA: hemolysin family protein [Acidimicrobiales bacterium]|nr:hemolysin family protein [Acidimicrobiales bacterium]
MSADAALVAAIVVLAGLAAFLAMAETSLTRTSPARAAGLRAEHRRGSEALARLTDHPERFLGPLLLVVLICQLVAATLVGVLAGRHLGPVGVAAAAAGEIIVFFALAEAAPKTWAMQHHDHAALLAAPVVTVLAGLPFLRLVTRALIGLANVVLPGKGLRQGPFVSEAELLAMADVAAEQEVIERRERAWIRSTIEFGDTVVREVMVPRPDMVTTKVAATVQEAMDVAMAAGLSRLPAVDPSIDDVTGLVYARDLMRAQREGRSAEPVRHLLRPAHLVPETKRIAELLPEMQRGRFHMAIVVDEYGDTAGLVTIEDLVEELVGEIADEYDVEEPLVEPHGDGAVRISGRIRIDEVNDLLGLGLPHGDWDTAAGFVCALLGHLPAEGEAADYGDYTLRAERVRGRRLGRIRVTRRAGAQTRPDVHA